MSAGSRRLAITGVVFAGAAFGQPVLPINQPKNSLERDIAAGDIHRYPIELVRGQIVHMLFVQELPFELSVKLIGAQGQVLAERSSRKNLFFSAAPAGEGGSNSVIVP